MIKPLKLFIILAACHGLAGCSTLTTTNSMAISNVLIIETGQNNGPRSDQFISTLCHNFTPTTQNIKRFFTYASDASDQEIHDDYELLPCFAKGTVRINDKQYYWKLRAGGVASLYNDAENVYKVCDEACCARHHIEEIC